MSSGIGLMVINIASSVLPSLSGMLKCGWILEARVSCWHLLKVSVLLTMKWIYRSLHCMLKHLNVWVLILKRKEAMNLRRFEIPEPYDTHTFQEQNTLDNLVKNIVFLECLEQNFFDWLANITKNTNFLLNFLLLFHTWRLGMSLPFPFSFPFPFPKFGETLVDELGRLL